MNKYFKITDVETFRHPQFGDLTALTNEQGDPWFLGKEIAEALGYTTPQDAINDHVLKADCKVLKYKAFGKTTKASELWKGQDYSDKTLINESGLYSLILGSKLEKAIEFKHWVTSEVLPQIRHTGGYIPTRNAKGERLSDFDLLALACKILERTVVERDRKIAEQKEVIEMLEPKADYCDEVLDSVNCMTMTQVAKEHGMSYLLLTQVLRDLRVIFSQSGQWMLYADYASHKLTNNRTSTYIDQQGQTHTAAYLVWTEKGRMFVDGILRRGLSPKASLHWVENVLNDESDDDDAPDCIIDVKFGSGCCCCH